MLARGAGVWRRGAWAAGARAARGGASRRGAAQAGGGPPHLAVAVEFCGAPPPP